MFNLKDLTIQTVLPNLVKRWDLEGFQAFHLCPIQEVSHSLYAIKDHLSIKYFRDFEELHNFIQSSKKIFFIDVVLNHTAKESQWLDDEECVYNERTVPQLTSALELDFALEQVQKYEDIEKVIKAFRIEEYFQIDLRKIDWMEFQVENENANSDDDDDDDDNIFMESNQEKNIKLIEMYLSNFGVSRYGVSFNFRRFQQELGTHQLTVSQILKALKCINEKQFKRAKQYEAESIANNQAHYQKYGCVQKYFYKLKSWYAAYNGYVDNIDPEEDFVTSQNFHYLRHTVNKWNVIKLRYGNKRDTPLLLNRMKQYICQMARYFHGIRLDNCHGTPLTVSQYLLKHARMENPKLLVFAELFGCSYKQQIKYMSKLGLNGQVDELFYCRNASAIVHKLQTCAFIPQISGPYRLIYDQTHDNQPPIVSSQGPGYLMSLVSALSFSSQFKGTTKLVDEFYDKHISCVYENRYYPQINQQLYDIEKRPITFMWKHTPPISSSSNQGAALPKVVKLKGSFDNWQQEYFLQNDQENPKYFTCQIELSPGVYEYKYIIDDVWTVDENQQTNHMNNIIEIKPIKAYSSLTFIRQLTQNQISHTYMESIHEQVMIITRCQEDHLQNETIVICLRPIIRKIKLYSKISSILYQYSFQYSGKETQNLDDEIKVKEHYIDVTTSYAKINDDILSINAPTSCVIILQCEPILEIQKLNEFLLTPFNCDDDMNLLYQPLINHYEVPGCGVLCYSGLYGVLRFINKIETLKDPFIQHIREGDWLIDYLCDNHSCLVPILTIIKQLPSVFKPHYFIKCIKHIVQSIEDKYTQHREIFFKQIDILSSYFTNYDFIKGRETFMSFKGILILTNKVVEAKALIFKYGNLMQHGLIPNSLKPLRYNTRDTCFWWIKAIRDYVTYTDDFSIISLLQEQIQCIFQSHATGIKFKEIYVNDDTDKEGLVVELKLDSETGFIMGGNYKNCLTWMDKMGSGTLNKGYPAASRDGAPIECTALLKACLDFIGKMHQQNKFTYPGIKLMNRTVTWRAWSDFICQHFEKSYYIPVDPSYYSEYQVIEKHVRRKGIYRDIFRCSKPRSEYQLRPNSCIAIALAPELFQKNHVIHHLALIESNLMSLNSLGLSTLDPIASEYSGKYIQLTDRFNAQDGFSIHNGSEFVFLLGYYLKALLKIHKQDIKKEIFYAYLAPIKQHLKEYYSLPDFTDYNGQLSEFAQKSSILSIALLKEAIFDLEEFSQKLQK
ncbi:unnamed protein product (macronuclear) [Paramecium tetraurelia]|uniref:Glycogen debranching enzyme n=1 Tax=Paramecium tetraurelia TaxID=5888 RepID=A0EEA7_PARTE|nr:uncharacterized protein GSPATT00025969001 [Paramecium tetraurelia]CAK93624.1 unnamed protein product [Paramecium tetraurelia]|eukprot:XP_001461021.1 hypothetical protein (macronuclear) [Paramecium tetraurelia strain d4-2]